MSITWGDQLLWILVGCSALMVVLWAVQMRTRDAGIVDVGWSASMGLAAAFCAATGEGDPQRRVMIGCVGMLWGLRLASHLLFDRVLKGPEDGRYQMLRDRFPRGINAVLLGFFLAQAVSVALLAMPFAIGAADRQPAPTVLDVAGLVVWLVGLTGETVADRQLRRFKEDAANRGQVCTIGLWRYSRHPNYFFEWMMWVAYALLASGSSLGPWAWSAPAIILFLVLKVTGIPPTEARAIQSRGEAYRRYQRTTSAFIPWFPKEDRA